MALVAATRRGPHAGRRRPPPRRAVVGRFAIAILADAGDGRDRFLEARRHARGAPRDRPVDLPPVGRPVHRAGDSGLNGDPDTKKDDIRGQMSASLALEGVFDQPASRRGRGDVLVNGRQLYQIPLVLGLLQITNLALPITSPFSEATCRYTVDGGRVTFETIELRAKQMLMQGSGHLDFDTKRVRMTFVTQNDTWPKLPVIGDLLQGARNELLQIHVRGTITEPQVSASAMNTLTTTIDEVFRGANPPPEAAAPKVKKTK